MLPSIEAAIAVKGRTNTAIAKDVARTAQTVTGWFSGRFYIPFRIRAALCEAIGAQIDWDEYEADYSAAQDARATRAEAAPPALPRAEDRPAAPPPVKMPAAAQTRPAQAPRRLTATPPARSAQSAPKAPATPSKGQGGIFGFLFDPSDDGMKFA